jgi:hypothetical protein
MCKNAFAAAALASLILVACDNAGDPAAEPPVEPAEQSDAAEPDGAAGERAQEALGRAGDAARETLENLGEAGRAGVEALQENAPEIREGLNEAGERIRNAGEALLNDPDPAPVDAEGDSGADANEVPERSEGTAQ